MKTLLTIIAAASLVVGCGVFEEEQTTTDSGVGVTTSAAPIPTGSAVTHWSGTKQLGTSGDDFAIGITSDPSGNVYVTGYTGDGLDGNASAGDNDSFVAKYDSGESSSGPAKSGLLIMIKLLISPQIPVVISM